MADPLTSPKVADHLEGRVLVRTNLWRIFWVSAVVTWIASGSPTSTLAGTWGRLAVIALCCLLVYNGRRWALWLLGMLTVFAGLMMVVVAFTIPEMSWTNRIIWGVSGAVQVLAFVILLKAPEVRAFMIVQGSKAKSSAS
jgi:hypothetical protein